MSGRAVEEQDPKVRGRDARREKEEEVMEDVGKVLAMC